MAPNVELAKAVVKVGPGRGFIVEAARQRLVITAAHCLPKFPPCHGASEVGERTSANLLGPLDDSEPTIWAECLFADPVGDVAVLGCPDDQVFIDEADAFEAWIDHAPALQIGEAENGSPAWMLTLDGRWIRCTVSIAARRAVWLDKAEEPIRGGMSGSPILDDELSAIGVVGQNVSGPQSRLRTSLPGWMFL